MDVTITGRKVQITDSFRRLVETRLDELDSRVDKVIRAEVQVQSEDRRGTGDNVRVEITLIGKGPVVRAEASADDKVIAFERAIDHLKTRLRRAVDRRREHRNLRRVGLVATPPAPPVETTPVRPDDGSVVPVTKVGGLEIQGEGPMVVREKLFWSTPLTLAQALDEMELVGHDFFLYVDTDSGLPSVVYRRRAYDYGVIHLKLNEE